MKKILVFILIACTAISLFSCKGSPTSTEESSSSPPAQNTEPITSETLTNNTTETLPKGAIAVYSAYPTLKYIIPGEFDISKTDDSTWARNGYRSYVGVYNGKLVIMPNHNIGSSGVDGVYRTMTYTTFNISGNKNGVYLGSERILDCECKGIILTPSKKIALVLTTNGTDTTVYIFEKEAADGEFDKSFKELKLEGELELYFINFKNGFYPLPDDLYILTSTGVYVMENYHNITSDTTESSPYRLVTIDTPDWWSHARLLNVAMTDDGTLFVGDFDGVIGIKDNVITYYPLQYNIYRS